VQQVIMIHDFSFEAKRSGIKVERYCIKNLRSKKILDDNVSYQSNRKREGAWHHISLGEHSDRNLHRKTSNCTNCDKWYQ
jgi:hypothetical protein